MRVLWVSHLIPYPPKSGAHLRSFNLLRSLAARHDVDLFAFVQEAWLDIFFSSRETGLLESRRALMQFCRSVTFIPIESLARAGGRQREALASLLTPEPYTLRWLRSDRAEQLLRHASTQDYRVAHFDTVGLAPFRELFRQMPCTLGHHNVESHIFLRRACNERRAFQRWYFRQEGVRLQKYETAIAGAFGRHFTCSLLDSSRLKAHAPEANSVEIPNGVDLDYFKNDVSVVRTEVSVIFVGSLNWYPNVDAVLFLLTEIWPRVIERRCNVSLDVVGSAPPKVVFAAASNVPSVRVHGFVDDVRPLINAASICVCPIRDGGGTKLKVLEAFSMEKCVVAHPIACEGINVRDGLNVRLATTAEDFASVICELLDSEQERRAMGAAARQLVEEQYSFASIGRLLVDAIEQVAGETCNNI